MSDLDFIVGLDDEWDPDMRRYTFASNISESHAFPTEAEAKQWRDIQVAKYEKLGYTISQDHPALPTVEEMNDDRWVGYIEAELIQYEDKVEKPK